MTRLSFHVYPVRSLTDIGKLEDALETLPAVTSLVVTPPQDHDAQVALTSRADLSPREVVQSVARQLNRVRISFDA